MRVLLIDGMNWLYRSYYSEKLTFNNHGEPVNALHRYLQIIDSFQRDYPCDEIVICEDAPRDTLFRQQLFTEYKAGRKPPPKELTFQKGILFGFLRRIGFPVVGVNGYEADDIIGTMSRSLSEDGHHVLIASSDKDMYQLLTNERIGYIRHRPDTRNQELLFRDDIHHEYGYWPEQVIDLKIICGDSSDNIRGIPGVNLKNGVKILQKYHSLDKLIERNDLDPIAERVKTYILEHKDDINRNRELIRIIRDIDPSLISSQLAYRVSEKVMTETMNRYQVINREEFENMTYYPYLQSRYQS